MQTTARFLFFFLPLVQNVAVTVQLFVCFPLTCPVCVFVFFTAAAAYAAAESQLFNQPTGSFLVRVKKSKPRGYCLSIVGQFQSMRNMHARVCAHAHRHSCRIGSTWPRPLCAPAGICFVLMVPLAPAPPQLWTVLPNASRQPTPSVL